MGIFDFLKFNVGGRRYIITTLNSEYGVWKDGGYWKIHFRGKDMFVAGLMKQGEGRTVVKGESITFDKITSISQFVGLRVKLYKRALKVSEGEMFLTLMVGSETSMVKSVREK